jgi:hypothetical protein
LGFDEGGQVIGKPGGLVEPGVTHYANELPPFVQKPKKSRFYRVRAKKTKDRAAINQSGLTLEEATEKASKIKPTKTGAAADLKIIKETQVVVDRYNKIIADKMVKQNLSEALYWEPWVKKNYPKRKDTILARSYRHELNYTDLKKERESLAKTLVEQFNSQEKMIKNTVLAKRLGLNESSIYDNKIIAKEVSKLDSLKDKVDFTMKNIKSENALIKTNLLDTIAERTGTGRDQIRTHLATNPIYKKNKAAIKYAFETTGSLLIESSNYGDIINEAKLKMGGTWSYKGENKPFYKSGARKSIMDFTISHWFYNKRDGTKSVIELYDAKGDPIKWKSGIKLNAAKVQFKIPGESSTMWNWKNLSSKEALNESIGIRCRCHASREQKASYFC